MADSLKLTATYLSLVSMHFKKHKILTYHFLFWIVMFLYYYSSNLTFFDDKVALTERTLIKTGLQIILTYFITLFLFPRLFNRNRKVLFGITTLLTIYLFYVLYTGVRYYYYDPKYLGEPKFDLYERFLDWSFYLNELTWFIFPSIIMITVKYYQDQKEILKLREQKRITELNLLKNQLNPHFLFNTLNNLYTLALKKSDRTPEVIGKLSAILDYMLYRCNESYVSLQDEVVLMQNYIDLEKVRYGSRLKIELDHQIEDGVTIAPLVLLTFLENAFKHGVKEEINSAFIKMQLQANPQEIHFSIENTKPTHQGSLIKKDLPTIGLENIQKQLAILYPNRHKLEICDKQDYYRVTLNLISNAL